MLFTMLIIYRWKLKKLGILSLQIYRYTILNYDNLFIIKILDLTADFVLFKNIRPLSDFQNDSIYGR